MISTNNLFIANITKYIGQNNYNDTNNIILVKINPLSNTIRFKEIFTKKEYNLISSKSIIGNFYITDIIPLPTNKPFLNTIELTNILKEYNNKPLDIKKKSLLK